MARRLHKVHSRSAAPCGEKPLLWRVGNLPQNPHNLAKGSKGKVTKSTDPVGRETVFEYDPNEIDLLSIRQKNPQSPTGYDVLTTFTYRPTDPRHLPATVANTSGQTTTYTYRSNGDIETVVTPERDNLSVAERTTTYEYYPDDAPLGAGRLQRVTGPLPGATTSFTYDDLGRVRTVTDSDGYTVTADYDAMDRPTKTTYPDGTFEETVYNRLDAERHRDRLGRWSHTLRDALRRVVATQDPLGRTITQVWCTCGSLDKLIDANGNETRWERDILGRVKKEIRANGSETVYTYENTTSRLKRVTDPKGQHKDHEYFLDDNLKQISYPNAENATTTVTFTYESIYDRVATVRDGTGETKYAYYPWTSRSRDGIKGGLLSSTTPITSDVS